ncbi:putative signal transducing protein [Nafulsella turpanensis]|uniref:putative signal transducing protein n=1 Tax=Nafulsella turpanensis TaxID=1265690 RepID=UPI00034858E4|nr:DUF2007 domain-containing protein [Nafulsella turpanensis]
MKKWINVYKSDNQYRAEIVKAVLEDNDLPAVLVNKKDRIYHLGYYEVHVSPDDVWKALKIISDDITFE